MFNLKMMMLSTKKILHKINNQQLMMILIQYNQIKLFNRYKRVFKLFNSLLKNNNNFNHPNHNRYFLKKNNNNMQNNCGQVK